MNDTVHDTRVLGFYPALVALGPVVDGSDLRLVESVSFRDVVVVVVLKGAPLA